jgi:poly(A) polymerase Pap1
MSTLKNPGKTGIANQKKMSGVPEQAYCQPPLYARDPNSESDPKMKKKILKALRSKGFHERRKDQALKVAELQKELEIAKQGNAEIARERDQLKIEIEKLKQFIGGGYVTFTSIDVSQNWTNEKDLKEAANC